jgi:type I restriction enzyme S subunit
MSAAVLLSDVAELVMGQSPPSTTYNDVGDGLPFYQGKTDFGATYPTPRIYCGEPKKLAEKGDILMSVRAPVGATNLCDSQSCIGRGIAAIRANGIDRDFLYFYLKEIEAYIDSLGSGAIFKAINKSQLAELPINEAGIPLPEQKKIAHILSTVQRAIEAQERIIQTTTELKKALMHKLFTEGLRNEPKKQTEIGPIPESWEVVELGSLAKVGNGSTPKRANQGYWEGGTIPWLNSTKIHDRFITEADQFVTPQAVKECHLPKVAPNSLLIAITGQGKTLGNSAITRIETCINQHLAYAQFNSAKIVPDFVLWFMQTRYDFLRAIAHGGGSTKGALTCGFLKTVGIPVPPEDEQSEIVNVFRTIDEKQTTAASKKAALQDLFRTLLHELMTAKTRVHNLDVTGKSESAKMTAEAIV